MTFFDEHIQDSHLPQSEHCSSRGEERKHGAQQETNNFLQLHLLLLQLLRLQCSLDKEINSFRKSSKSYLWDLFLGFLVIGWMNLMVEHWQLESWWSRVNRVMIRSHSLHINTILKPSLPTHWSMILISRTHECLSCAAGELWLSSPVLVTQHNELLSLLTTDTTSWCRYRTSWHDRMGLTVLEN